MSDETVFVLGAGFTRAFIEDSPLLTDAYPLDKFLAKFRSDEFPYAHKILKLEQERLRFSGGRFDLERLMTRLHSSMPHDFEHRCTQELEHLRHDLYDDFVEKLRAVNKKREIPETLRRFAQWCVKNCSDCITFNYDDFLDEALWRAEPFYGEPSHGTYWHPNSGYGFFCPPAESLLQGGGLSMGRSSMLLLKLHGSINWRIKRGATDPYQLDTILHSEIWLPSAMPTRSDDAIERHLEQKRFIVLPVLMKSDLTDQPIFQLLWAEAHKVLARATRVVFIGYSMPRTDIAAACLFGEALQETGNIEVVSRLTKIRKTERHTLMSSYQSVLPQLTARHFHFKGALDWLENNDFLG